MSSTASRKSKASRARTGRGMRATQTGLSIEEILGYPDDDDNEIIVAAEAAATVKSISDLQEEVDSLKAANEELTKLMVYYRSHSIIGARQETSSDRLETLEKKVESLEKTGLRKRKAEPYESDDDSEEDTTKTTLYSARGYIQKKITNQDGNITWECSCPDHHYRRQKPVPLSEACKHAKQAAKQ